MREEVQAAGLIAAVLVIGVAGLLLTDGLPGVKLGQVVNPESLIGYGDLYLENYKADLYLNGTLEENDLYRIENSGKYRMLYRLWKLPISQNGNERPSVKMRGASSSPGTMAKPPISQSGIDGPLVKPLGASPSALSNYQNKSDEQPVKMLGASSPPGTLAKQQISQNKIDGPYVETLGVSSPPGTIAYAKDYLGDLLILSKGNVSSIDRSTISSLAELNEVGCFKPGMYAAGSYEIDYLFRLHPPLECDSEYCHWNLRLADEHIPYKQLTVSIHDHKNLIVQIFPHPAMDVNHNGDTWTMTGSSPKDAILGVEMLLKPEARGQLDGFSSNMTGIKEMTISANSEVFPNPVQILRGLVLIFPAVLVLIYFRYGREKHFIVPKTLSYVPGKRKPWLVNLVFKGDPFDFDKDGFYATLLDLNERGVLNIDSKDGLNISLLKGHDAAEDEYERMVMQFLEENSIGKTFDAIAFEKMVKDQSQFFVRNKESLQALHETMDNLLRYRNKDAASEFVSGLSLRVIGNFDLKYLAKALFVLVIIFAFAGGISLLKNTVVATSLVLVVQAMIPVMAPSSLFGKWKQDYYKEKLEWDSFARFLSDFASIQKYAPEDLSMWKEWLIYGTALGVGDKVRTAMEMLNVQIPVAYAVNEMHTHFGNAYSTSAPKSSGSGGGFGGGGGSGGGGAGGR